MWSTLCWERIRKNDYVDTMNTTLLEECFGSNMKKIFFDKLILIDSYLAPP